MKEERRKKVISIADTQPQSGISAWFYKHGNTLLTGVLIVAAVALLVRWRLNAAAVARQDILNQLNEARSMVDQLHSLDNQGSPADLIKTVQTIETDSNSKLSNILNTSDDNNVRAQAEVIRGDLYWQMANLPEFPGSASEPTLRLKNTADDYLAKAADAFNAVVNTPDYAKASVALNSARLGLAAIAENRNDWAGARKQLDAVKADPAASAEKLAAADIQLQFMLNNMQDRIYVAPPTGTAGATTEPAGGVLGPVRPTTGPMTSQPTTPVVSTPMSTTTMPILPASRPVH